MFTTTLKELGAKNNKESNDFNKEMGRDAKVSLECYIEGLEKVGPIVCFVFRDGIEKIFGYRKEEKDENGNIDKEDNYLNIPIESFIMVTGILETNNFDSTNTFLKDVTIPSLCIKVEKINILSICKHTFENTLEKILNSNKGVVSSLSKDYEEILKNTDKRFLSLRLIENQAIFAIRSKLRNLFTRFFIENDFVQIEIPKLLSYLSVSEDLSFRVNYFGREVYLNQHEGIPMVTCIQGGMSKIFRIGDNFRAEKKVSNRHLTQFTVITFYMRINDGERELYELMWRALSSVFKLAEKECERELKVLRKRFGEYIGKVNIGEKPIVIKYSEALELINQNSNDSLSFGDDLKSEDEKLLGEIIKEKHGSDLFIINEYPYKLRGICSKIKEENKETENKNMKKTYSFDTLLRGQEISTSIEYEEDIEKMRKVEKEEGKKDSPLNKGFWENMAEGFEYGIPKFGGLGIGFDRLVKLFLGFEDIKTVVLFPRDFSSICP